MSVCSVPLFDTGNSQTSYTVLEAKEEQVYGLIWAFFFFFPP